MGRKTYEATKGSIDYSDKILRIIVTKKPDQYDNAYVQNHLEFTNSSPQKIVRNLEARGYKEVILAGGEQLNTVFLKRKLVDELWLTVEPVIFCSGHQLASKGTLDINLSLLKLERLNTNGTLLLKYRINN